jgi:hypothetical protein
VEPAEQDRSTVEEWPQQDRSTEETGWQLKLFIFFKRKKNIQRGNHTTTPNEKEEVAALQGRSTEERRCIYFYFFCLFGFVCFMF